MPRGEASKLGEIILTRGAPSVGSNPPVMLTAALLDALNPCMLGFFLVLLTLLSYSRNALGSGASFIIAVYATRLAIGLGLMQAFWVPQAKLVVSAFALALGFFKVFQSVRGGRQIPAGVAERVESRIEDVSNPLSSFFAGCFVSLFVAACSSPAYFLAPTLIGAGEVFPLLVYNLVVVAPLIVSTICLGLLNVEGLRSWVSSRRRFLDFIIGLGVVLTTLIINLF